LFQLLYVDCCLLQFLLEVGVAVFVVGVVGFAELFDFLFRESVLLMQHAFVAS
jgi:hypothetical protein